ncbi:MAG: hypothetical protein ACOYNO_06010 [Saprospiraceae bacterium]
MCNVSNADLFATAARPVAFSTSDTATLFTHDDAHVFGDIVFGSPKDDCRGSGICSVVALTDTPSASSHDSCRRARACMRLDAGSGGVEIVFRHADLCSLLVKNIFRKSTFLLPQTCELPPSIVEALRLPGCRLVPGEYPVKSLPGAFAFNLLLS